MCGRMIYLLRRVMASHCDVRSVVDHSWVEEERIVLLPDSDDHRTSLRN